MATIKLSSTSFKTANPKINVGDYTVENDTGLTKQGTGAYYNNTDYKTVNFDSLGKPLSAGVISPPSLISITGLIEAGTNIGITGVGTLINPYIINCTLVPSAYGLPSVLAVDAKTNNIPITSNDLSSSVSILDGGVIGITGRISINGATFFDPDTKLLLNGNYWQNSLSTLGVVSYGTSAGSAGGYHFLEPRLEHYFDREIFYTKGGIPMMDLNVYGDHLLKYNSATASSVSGFNANGCLISLNLGTNLSFDASTNTLNATGGGGAGTVTSVSMTVPTGLSISGSPITTSGTLALSLTSGYVIPTTTEETNWNTAYTNRITSAVLPLSIASNAISISQATTSTNGYLSSTDWNTFNSKGSGTVTSVGLSMPSAFTVTSSPITTSGTIAITGAGTTAQYIDGTGALQTFPTIPSITGLVPYTGATSDVDLGEKELTTGKLWLYDAAGGPTEKGSLHYADEALHFENSDAETLLYVEPGFMQLHKTGTIQSNFFTTLLTVNRDHYLPDASGTIALTSNIGTWGALNYPIWTTGTPFVKMTAAGIFALDTNTYLTGNQSITLSGEASGTGTTSISVTLANSAVIAKVLTGYVSGAGTVSATDSILQAIQKLNGNIGGLTTGVSSVNSLTGAVALTGTANQISISAANIFSIPSNSQLSVAKLTNLTTNGFVKTSGSDGTLSIDTSTYLTGNQTITLSGDVTGSGTTSITTTVKSNFITDTLYRTFDGQLSVININTTAILTIPYNCTITGWTLLEISNTPITSTCVLAVSKVIYSSYYGSPSIVSGLTPSLTSAVKNQATGLSISATAGDVFIISITSLTSAQKLLINLNLTKT